MSEDARRRILQLLQRGTDSKLLAHNSEAARRHLEEARRLAEGAHAVADPLKHEIAYRLGVLRLRSAGTAAEVDDCVKLLLEAARTPEVGPWPGIYLAAALIRLLGMVEDQHRPQVRHRLERTWSLLVDRPDLEAATESAVQHLAVNLLETLSIAGGLDVTSLIGRGVDRPEAHLVDSDPTTFDLNLPWRLARAEAAAMADLRRCWAFSIREDGHTEARPSGGAWEPKPEHGLPIRILALVLAGRARTKDRIEESIGYPAEMDPSRRPFTKALSRLRALLAQWSDLSRAEVLPWEGTLLKPHPDLRVIGAVHEAGLALHER